MFSLVCGAVHDVFDRRPMIVGACLPCIWVAKTAMGTHGVHARLLDWSCFALCLPPAGQSEQVVLENG